jgi:hypothetical protein
MPLIDETGNEFVPAGGTDVPPLARTKAPQGSIWGAAFRTENEIGSLLSKEYESNAPQPSFNSWESLRRLGRESDWDYVSDARNEAYMLTQLGNLDRERQDREQLAAAPWYVSLPVQMAAGVASPLTLLPGGGAVRAVKGGFSMSRSAALTAAWAVGGVTAQEAALQATQLDRGYGESAFAIGGGAILGALFGAGAAKALTRAERQLLEDVMLPKLYTDTPEVAVPEMKMPELPRGVSLRIDKETGAVIRSEQVPIETVVRPAWRYNGEVFEAPSAISKIDGNGAVHADALEVLQAKTGLTDEQLDELITAWPKTEGRFPKTKVYREGNEWPNELTAGFVTNTGRYVDRYEAKRIADEAGQVNKYTSNLDILDAPGMKWPEKVEVTYKTVETVEPKLSEVEQRVVDILRTPDFQGGSFKPGGADVARETISREDFAPAGFAGKLAKVGAQFIPSLRLAASPFRAARQIAQMLTPSNLYTRGQMAGKAMSPGGAIETDMERMFNELFAKGIRAHDEAYKEMRKAGVYMNKGDFDRAVGRAARFNDVGVNEYVSKAAADWRNKAVVPMQKIAQEVGGLPADMAQLDINEQITYFSRSHNRKMIVQNSDQFFQRLRPHARRALDDGLRKAIEDRDLKVKEWERQIELLSLGKQARQEELARIDSYIDEINNYFPEDAAIGAKIEQVKEAIRKTKDDTVKATLKDDLAALRSKVKGTDHEKALRRAREDRKLLSMSRGAMEQKVDEAILKLEDLYDQQVKETQKLVQRGQKFEQEASKNAPEVWEKKRADLRAAYYDKLELHRESIKNLEDQRWAIENERQRMEAAIWERVDNASEQSNIAALKEQQVAMKEELDKFNKLQAPIEKKIASELKRQEMLEAQIDRLVTKIDAADEYDVAEVMQVFKEATRELQEDVASRMMFRGMRAQRMSDTMEKWGPPDAKIKELRSKIDAKKAKFERKWEDKPGMLKNLDQIAEGMVKDYYDAVTGLKHDPDPEFADFIQPVKVGPLKGRSNWVPEEALIEPVTGYRDGFLYDEAPLVWKHYLRVMAGDAALRRQFGKIDMVEQLNQIDEEAFQLLTGVNAATTVEQVNTLVGTEFKSWFKGKDLNATKKAAREFLDNQARNNKEDLHMLRDKVLGRYLVAENSTNYAQLSRVMNNFNYIRLMGGAAITTLTETFRPAMIHGVRRYADEIVRPMINNMEALKLSVEEARLAGTVLETINHQKVMAWADIDDPMARGTGVDRMMANATSFASKWNGLSLITEINQAAASILTQNKLLKAAINGTDIPWMRFNNISEGQGNRIAKLFKQHGEIVDGVHVANTERWTAGLAGEELKQAEAAVRAYRNAIKQEVDSVIVMPGMGDAPNFAATPTGRMLFQFMSYALSAHQKVMLRGMQEDGGRLASSIVAMSIMGMGVATLQAWRGGEERWQKFKRSAENPGFLIGEGLDKSGIFPMIFDLGNRVDTVSRGMGKSFNPIKTPMLWPFPGDSQAGDQTRWGQPNNLAGLFGPTAGLVINDLPRAGGAIAQALTPGETLTMREQKSISNLAPYAPTYPGIKELLQVLHGDSPYMR